MKKKKLTAANLILILGTVLVVASVGLLAGSLIFQSREQTQTLTKTLRSALPDSYNGAIDDRADLDMPAVEIGAESFCGLLEVPAYGRELPIGQEWEPFGVGRYPRVFLGSIYDGSLVIGGSDGSGQLDFLNSVSHGDAIFLTDMTGGKYSYRVTDIRKTRDVSAAYFSDKDADLILFARNTFALDYTVVRCKLS